MCKNGFLIGLMGFILVLLIVIALIRGLVKDLRKEKDNV